MKLPLAKALLSLLLATTSPLVAAQVGESIPEGGTLLEMPDGSSLHFQIDSLKIQAHFADSAGLVIEPKAEAVIVEIKNTRNEGWRALLAPGEGAALTSPRTLTQPHLFRARIVVRFPDGETHTFPNALLDLSAAGE